MAVYFVSKDKRFRSMYFNMENTRTRLNFFLDNSFIAKSDKCFVNLLFSRKIRHFLPFSVKSRNRCTISGRAGSVFRYFKLSRICLKNLASNGFLTGIRKSSW